MKHINKNQVKTCAIIPEEQFRQDVYDIFGTTVEINIDFEGISFDTDDEKLDNEQILQKLSEYYDINITSIHIDDCDLIGVWIVYE